MAGNEKEARWKTQKGRARNVDGKIKLWQCFEKEEPPGSVDSCCLWNVVIIMCVD